MRLRRLWRRGKAAAPPSSPWRRGVVGRPPSLHSSSPFLLPPRERGEKSPRRRGSTLPLCLRAGRRFSPPPQAGGGGRRGKEEEEEACPPPPRFQSPPSFASLRRRVWSFARQSDVSRSCKRTRLGADTAKQIRYT